jgi:hypothetical protein
MMATLFVFLVGIGLVSATVSASYNHINGQWTANPQERIIKSIPIPE